MSTGPVRRRLTSAGAESRERSAAAPIRIVVADDQPIDRRGLAGLLATQSDFEVVGEAASGEEAVERCARLKPDIIVMDVMMPGMDGVAALPELRIASPLTRAIMLAERGERRCLVLNPPRPGSTVAPPCGPVTDCLQVAVARGAHGALRRSAEPEDLFRAVRAVAAGNAWYEPGTAARMLEKAMGSGAPGRERALSAREVEVAGHIADGHSNKEIGRALGISEATVKKHVRGVLHKLRLEDRLQVGLYFARNPLLLGSPPPEPVVTRRR